MKEAYYTQLYGKPYATLYTALLDSPTLPYTQLYWTALRSSMESPTLPYTQPYGEALCCPNCIPLGDIKEDYSSMPQSQPWRKEGLKVACMT